MPYERSLLADRGRESYQEIPRRQQHLLPRQMQMQTLVLLVLVVASLPRLYLQGEGQCTRMEGQVLDTRTMVLHMGLDPESPEAVGVPVRVLV